MTGEQNQLHFGLFGPSQDLLACVVAVRLSPTEARIRQMAVSPSHQRKGLGRRIMSELENYLQGRGFNSFVLNARTSAEGFYEQLGYTVVGGEYVDFTVPHVRMTKTV